MTQQNRYLEKARVFVRKGAAEKALIRLINNGFVALIGTSINLN